MVKASLVQDTADQSPDKPPAPLSESWAPAQGMLTSQGCVLLSCSTNTDIPLRHMLEDTKTKWLWECLASEGRKDLVSSKSDLPSLD